MWLGPLHDSEFVDELITTIEAEKENYGTFPRMKGMLTMAREVGPGQQRIIAHARY